MNTPVKHHSPAQATELTAVSEPFDPEAFTPEQALDRYNAVMAVVDGVVDSVPTDRPVGAAIALPGLDRSRSRRSPGLGPTLGSDLGRRISAARTGEPTIR